MVPASKPTRSIGCGTPARHAAMSSTSHGNSRSSTTLPPPSTMHSAHDRSDTSSPAKYSIIYLPCSQLCCDPIGSSTSEQRQPSYACFEPNLMVAASRPDGRPAQDASLHSTGFGEVG